MPGLARTKFPPKKKNTFSRSVFSKKQKNKIRLKTDIHFAQVCPVVAKTWFESRSEFFLAQKLLFPPQNTVLCYRTLDFVNGPFVALGKMVDFTPLLCTFRSRETAVFVQKTWLTRQKVFPHPTVGALSASDSPSALSAPAQVG